MAVYLGVDIGKSTHYALAVDVSGKPIYQSGVPNDEAALHEPVDWVRDVAANWLAKPAVDWIGLMLLLWISRNLSAASVLSLTSLALDEPGPGCEAA